MRTLSTKEQIVLKVVGEILDNQNQVTTLEVKNKLRVDHPNGLWVQPEISLIMDGFYRDGVLSYNDNGVYREYYLPSLPTPVAVPVATVIVAGVITPTPPATAPVAPSTSSKSNQKKAGVNRSPSGRISEFQPVNQTKVGVTKALELIKDSKGQLITVCFYEKDGKKRILNGKYKTDQTQSPLGYVLMYDYAILKKTKEKSKSIRNVNLQTLEDFKIGGVYYSVDRKTTPVSMTAGH